MKSYAWLTITLSSTLALGTTVPEPTQPNGPIIPPRESHPFGALETRPLWDRPVGDTTPSLRSQPTKIEPDVDRDGRIEDSTTFDLKQIRSEQLDPTGNLPALKEQQREEDVEQLRLKSDREANRVKRYEREDQVLAQVRRDWQQLMKRENAAGGAVVDRMALDKVESDYRAAISTAVQQRDNALTQMAGAQRAPGDDQKRAEILKQFEAARQAAIQARDARKEVILGHK